MRLLFLNPVGSLGGAETSLLALFAGLRALEPDWELHLLLGGDGPLREKARNLGVTVTSLAFPPPLSTTGDASLGFARKIPCWKTSAAFAVAGLVALRYALSVRRHVRNLRPDVIHTNGMKMHVLGSMARSSTPLIWHMHDYLGGRPLMRSILRLCSPLCSAIIANSRSVALDLRRLGMAPEIVLIYNGVDFDRFSPQGVKCDLDAMAGLDPAPAGAVRIGLLATFARWKGHLVFLRAIGQLPPELAVRAFIIGDGIYQTGGSQFERAELERAADEYCPGKTGFTGFVDDAASAIRALDIVVHASTQPEPFGMAILEGMACGKAVIASLGGGATEIFEDGVTALGHPIGDSDGLAACIRRLVSDAPLRAAMGERARVSVTGRFTEMQSALGVANLYRKVSRRRSRRPASRDSIEARLAGPGE